MEEKDLALNIALMLVNIILPLFPWHVWLRFYCVNNCKGYCYNHGHDGNEGTN